MQPGRDILRLRDAGDSSVGQLDQPTVNGDGILGYERRGAAHVGHVEDRASSVDMLERPELLPLFERQRPGPAIDLAHRLDILARVGEKALPFHRMLARTRAFDAEQSDQLLAVFLLAGAAEIARGALEIGWQVGDASLNHRINGALRREEGKSERGIIPDGGIKAHIPRGEGCATLEGGAKLVRRVVPIEDRAVSVPS